MGRRVRDYRLETRQARLRLSDPKNREPFWRLIHPKLHLGYRKGTRGGVWMVRFMRDNQYQKKVLAHADDFQDSNGQSILDYSEALNAAMQYARQDFTPHKAFTVRQAADNYLAWYREHRKAYEGTLANINAHILPIFGDKLVSELKTLEIRDWLHKLATTPARKRFKDGRKPEYRSAPKTENEKRARKSSANRTLSILKAILNKAFQDEYVSDDKAWRRVKPFQNADEPVIRFLTEAESKRLINAAREDFRQLVKGALFTGARYSELTTLKAKNVNLDTKAIYIQPSKSGKGRHIPLSPQGLDVFKMMTVGKTGEQYVFLKNDGKAWGRNHHSRLLQDACDNAKIEPAIGFHELRHTYASLLAQNGAELLTISKLLGHADTRITARHYAHLCDKTLASAVNKLLPTFGHEPDSKLRQI